MTRDGFIKSPLIPMSWGVRCPSCEEISEVEHVMDDHPEAEPDPTHGAQFVECECGQLIEVVGVRVSPIKRPETSRVRP